MQSQQAPRPRSRSAFAAAFLSLIFPGLGHAYAGAGQRALLFAAVPVLVLALALGIFVSSDRIELLGSLAQPDVLTLIFVVNVVLAAYRAVAAIDAWRVARFLNDMDASGDGRAGRVRLPLNPLSLAGLAAVLLVLFGGHAVVARFDLIAQGIVNCVDINTADQSCDDTGSPSPGASPSDDAPPPSQPGDSDEPEPTPISTASGTPVPDATPPPWNGKDRLNILLIGSDQRPREGTYNTDTMIVVSIDPQTNQVAMFQLPRDAVGVPVPANAQRVWGSTYGGKINSWFTANRNMSNLWPGNSRTRGYNALKAILGNLYGLNVQYFVEVNFQGFRKVVDTLGGVNINVQVPVSDDRFPGEDNWWRRLYIPAGPQHMTGEQALMYARSRHTTNDFDRGRRQQRVLLSIRQQADINAIFANVDDLASALKQSVRTDIPPNMYAKLLGLASRIDVKSVRSFVFAPPVYGTETPPSAPVYKLMVKASMIRSTVRTAFSSDPQLEARRETLGTEAASIWVLNGSGRDNQAAGIAGFLEYNGLAASSPATRPATTRTAKIVVYNGAEEKLPATIAFLESTFKVKATTKSDPTISVDIVITTGSSTPDLTAPAAG